MKVKNQKIIGGSFFGPKMMILQGVIRWKPYVGVCYANNPKKGGGYATLAPVVDLTTSLRGDFRRLRRRPFCPISQFGERRVQKLWGVRREGLKWSGVDTPLSSSRACPAAFIAAPIPMNVPG